MNQISFDPLDYQGGAAEAKRERNAEYKRLRDKGVNATRWVLRGQLRKYASFGVEDGRVRDVYYIQVN